MSTLRCVSAAECAGNAAGLERSGEENNMADSQGDMYVRRDVFEARMDRMEMLLEKTVLEIKSYVDKSTGEIKTYVEKTTADTKTYVDNSLTEIKSEIGEIKKDVKALTVRVDVLEQTLGARMGAVENTLTWWIALFAAVIALTTLLPPILVFLREKFHPSVTVEDIKILTERIVNLERHLSGGK